MIGGESFHFFVSKTNDYEGNSSPSKQDASMGGKSCDEVRSVRVRA